MFNRKRFYDILDELDKLMNNLEQDIEDIFKKIDESGSKFLSQPIVYGLSMKIEDGGEPVLKLFGDGKLLKDGFREPLYDQMIDEESNLKLCVEMPGVDKDDVKLDVLEDKAIISAIRGERKYKAIIRFKVSIDPSSGFASYYNGILEATFKVKNKTNNKYTEIKVE